MPRGIVPVVALLIVASVFTQFGGSPSPLLLESALQSGAPPDELPLSKPAVPKVPSDICKDLTPCVPRIELGPWAASCGFVRSLGVPGEKSPMVALNLGRPISKKLPEIADTPTIIDPTTVRDALPLDEHSLGRWCLTDSFGPITTVIVTLPDPIGSHLALDFDRRIDAIQAAALDSGYVLDQFWLPWDGSAGSATDDPDKAGKDRVLRRLRHSQPGLQIFRPKNHEEPKDGTKDQANKKPQALYVFLVAETPTMGINLPQFGTAIEYAEQVQAAIQPNPSDSLARIKILGPGFSGSIPALVQAIDGYDPTRRSRLDVIPSSATDHDLLANLHKALPALQTVLHDDDAALERFLEYSERDLHIAASDVAIVSESQTAYGSGVGDSDPATEKCRDKNGTPDNTLRACVLKLNFPREIYRLRSAYPDQQHAAAGSARPDTAPSSGLALNLKSSAGREDNIPSFSREQLPLSQEAVMLALAETIHRRKIKMVGVFASDVFDSLFVMRFFHEFSPDVRLFVLDSDLLFIRAADNLSLQGTLAVTDYPLFSSAQFQPGDQPTLRSFPSRNAEVTYNAFFALTGNFQSLRDYSWKRLEAADCGSHGAPAISEPTLWLAVVSRNGFQPVHLLDCKSNEGDALPFVSRDSQVSPFKFDRPSGGYLVLCALLLGLTAAQLALAYFARDPKAYLLGWTIEYFHIAEKSAAQTQKAYLLANSFIALAVLDFIVFLPVWYISFLAPCDGLTSIWYFIVTALSIGAVAGALYVAIRLSKEHSVFDHQERPWLAFSWLIALIYASVWIGFCFWPGTDSTFFLYRSLDLSNGCSPLLPHLLLFVAIYFWSFTNVRRVHFWQTRRQSLFLSSLDGQYHSHFADLEKALDTGFGKLFFNGHSWIILVLVVTVLILLRPFSHIAGIEPYPFTFLNIFDALYVSYLLLVTAFLTHALLRFIYCWAALQKILRRLERQPIRHAFDRLPKKTFSWTPVWHAGGARRSYVLQTRALECLKRLSSLAKTSTLRPDITAWVDQSVRNLEDKTSTLMEAEAAGSLDLEPANTDCQEDAEVKTIANRILQDILIDHWNDAGASESVDHHDKQESERFDSGVRYLCFGQPPEGKELYVVAEEFVALRIVAYMRYVGVQLRNLLSFVGAGFILCVASVRSYPFLAHRSIGWALTLIFLGLGLPVVIAFAQMDKDAILSRLSDTQPGKLDSAFYARLISYGALPLLTVLASQFPAIGRFLFSWVQPAIEALH